MWLGVMEQTVHESIICSICKLDPIVGVRYKCSCCPNFNICDQCLIQVEEHNLHSEYHPDFHYFIRIRKPSTGSASAENETSTLLKDKSKWVHYGVTCEECSTTPITGFRYVSTIEGKDSSLCESCEQNIVSCSEYTKSSRLKMIPSHMFFEVRSVTLLQFTDLKLNLFIHFLAVEPRVHHRQKSTYSEILEGTSGQWRWSGWASGHNGECSLLSFSFFTTSSHPFPIVCVMSFSIL